MSRIHTPDQAIDELHEIRCDLAFLSSIPEEVSFASASHILSLLADRLGECNEVLDDAECHEIEEEIANGTYPTGPVSFEHPCPDFFDSGFVDPDNPYEGENG